MTSASEPTARALEAGTRAGVLASLSGRPSLTLPDIQRLTRHLEALSEPNAPLRIGVLHTYTSDLLTPYLRFEAMLQGLDADIYHGPYGLVMQEATSSSGLASHNPDLTVLLLQWEDLDPAIASLSGALSSSESSALAQRVCARLLRDVGAVRQSVGGHLVVTLLPPLRGPGFGDYDAMAPNSERAWRSSVTADIASALRTEVPSSTFLDLDESVASIGRDRFFDLRWWYTSRFPFSPVAAQELARRVIAVGVVLKRPRAKVIVLDADNTLWGGIIGEDGMHGIGLGPEYPGNAFVAFQQRILQYQQRGFVLALCSKNNEADVLEVLRNHPHQVLREEHFAAMAINWESKPQNLRALAERLKLGLESFVFVDDSAHECESVRQALPMIEVVQTPSRAVDIPACLDRVVRLEVLTITDEDRRKTELYVQESQRAGLAAASTDSASYLRSLGMEMSVMLDDPRHITRIAQLTQKTNQFNLTTRRYTEEAIARLIADDEWMVAAFSLRDTFGDAGIVGIALIRIASAELAEIDTLLMSCRVIGRSAESAFLDAILRELSARGVRHLVAEYQPTAKNRLVERFLPDHRFALSDDGKYRRDLATEPPAGEDAYPIRVDVTGSEAPAAALRHESGS